MICPACGNRAPVKAPGGVSKDGKGVATDREPVLVTTDGDVSHCACFHCGHSWAVRSTPTPVAVRESLLEE